MNYQKTAIGVAVLAVALGFANTGLGLVFALLAGALYLIPRGN